VKRRYGARTRERCPRPIGARLDCFDRMAGRANHQLHDPDEGFCRRKWGRSPPFREDVMVSARSSRQRGSHEAQPRACSKEQFLNPANLSHPTGPMRVSPEPVAYSKCRLCAGYAEKKIDAKMLFRRAKSPLIRRLDARDALTQCPFFMLRCNAALICVHRMHSDIRPCFKPFLAKKSMWSLANTHISPLILDCIRSVLILCSVNVAAQ
jgi:hypothetical protein